MNRPKRIAVPVFVTLICLLALGAVGSLPVAAAPVELTQCQTVGAGGEYVLGGDVDGSANATCFVVTANNVSLDGAGYTITGSDASGSIGIHVNGSTGARLENVTVTNLTVVDWETGLYYDASDDGTVRNVTTISNTNYGLYFQSVTNVTVDAVTTTDNDLDTSDAGLRIEESTGLAISGFDSTSDNNGVDIYRGSGHVIRDSTFSGSTSTGVDIIDAQQITVNDSSFTDSAIAVDISDSGEVVVDNNTIIDGQLGHIFGSDGLSNRITNNSVFENSGLCSGMFIDDAADDIIANNTMMDCNSGTLIEGSNQITFRNNTISGTSGGDDYGLRVSGGANHMIVDNHLVNNGRLTKESGIYLDTYQATLLGNTLAGNGLNLEIQSDGKWGNLSHSIDPTNTVEGRPVAYHVNETDVTVDPNAGWVGLIGTQNAVVADMDFAVRNPENILLFEADDTLVRNVEMTTSSWGIRLREGSDRTQIRGSQLDGGGIILYDSTGTQIANTLITNSGSDGVDLHADSPNTTFENVTITGSNDYGIGVREGSFGTERITVANSTVSTNGNGGINLYNAVRSVVRNSTIENNGGIGIRTRVGFSDDAMRNGTFTENTVISNDGDGITFEEYAADNRVTNNTITDNNGAGIVLGWRGYNETIFGNVLTGNNIGINLPSIYDLLTVYDNQFNNTQNVNFADPAGVTNASWNTTATAGTSIIGGNTIGGNYWANQGGTGYSQTCTDRGDGICGTAYTIATGHVDALPLAMAGAPPEPAITVSTASVDFGTLTVGSTVNRTVTINNTGTADLAVSDVSVSGTDAGEFAETEGSFTLTPGATRGVTVSFAPTSAGSKTASLTVTSDDPTNSTVSLNLLGESTTATEPDISVSTASVDFGTVDIGMLLGRWITVSNTGDDDLTVSNVSLAGSDVADFGERNSAFSLSPGATQRVDVSFIPTSAGPKTATLVIQSDDPTEPTVTISLLGTGAATSSNRVPVAAADHYVVTKDETLTVTAPGRLANDLDPDGDSITVAHASNPANGTLESNAANGSFTYSPDSGFTGTDTFSYRIRDANGSDSSFVPVTIEVVADPNRAPTAVADSYVVVQDETLSVSAPGLLANDADADSDTITATGSGAPTHGTMNLVTDGSFTYTPDSGFSGTDSFQYRIEDANGEDSAYATVTIEVLSDPNRAPTAISDQYSVATGETLTVSAPGLLRNDYDLDSDSISAVSYGRPNHGTLSLTTDGSFTYTSDPGYSGVDTFSYRIEDEHGEKSWYGTVSIDVTAPNRVPTAVSDHYTTLRGQNLSVDAPGVLANDYDPDSDSITTTGFSSPTNGSLSLTVDGSLTYVPDPGFTGTETLSYRIEDEHGTDSSFAALTIEVVDPSTTAPVATADSYTVDAGETLSVAATGLLANDRDPNDDSVSATGSTTPTHGTLNLVTDGSFTYTPNPGFSGTDSFQYRIRDANGEESAFTTVTIEVLPDPNRPPTAISDHYTVSAGETLTVDSPGVLDNDYDVDSDTVTTANFGRPNHGTVSLSVDGSLAYTPDSGFSGTDRFSYRIEDEHGVDSSFARISIEVIEPNREPTVVDDYYSIYAGETLSVDAPGLLSNDDDPDGDSISTVSSSRPAHGSRSLTTTGSFTYTPDPGYSGTDSFSYRIEDEHGENSWFGTVTIEVLPDPNRAPTASPDSYIMLQGESLTVNSPGLLANDYDADSDSVTTTNFGRPNHGTVSLSSTGSLTYVPDPSFTGTDTFVYRIEDEHGEDSLFVPVMITVVDTSVSGGPAVAVAQDSVDFGPTAAGATTTETVTVANIGDQNLTVSGATISGPNASAFAVTGGNESTVLGFGATRTLTVEYAPTAAGTDNATLTVLSDDPNEPAVAVALSGTASDDTAPTINTIVATGSSRDGSTVYTNETVDVAVHATDQFGTVGEVRISLDSQQSSYRVSKPATYDEILGNWTVSFTASDLVDDDWYDVIVTTADGEGNSATQTATDRVVVDRLPPQLAATVTRINSTAANVTVTSQSVLRTDSVAVDVEHPDGTVVPVQLKSDGSDWNGTFGLPVDGQYNLTATAVDLAGNRGTDRVTTSLSTESTDGNNTITTQIQPSGLFVRFTTNQSVNDTFVTMTESQVAVAPLVRGESGVTFLDAVLGNSLSSNLSYAQIGLPVDQSLLAAGTDVDDVTIRYFNESSNRWEDVSTTVENVTVNGSTDQYWVATVTHFSTYGAVVADTTPPTVTSTTPTDGHQLPAGTSSTTLRVEYDDTQTGINTGRTVVSFDDSLVTTDDATTVTSRYVEFEATGLTDGSSHELAVTIEDQAGNAHTETLSFTLKTATVPAPQPSGGGTSSSRQRSDVTPENPLRPQGYADIGADGRATVTLTDARVVDRIEVTIPGATGRTTVTELTDLPDGVSQPDGTNIALFDITAPNPASGTATVRISLNQSTVVSTGTRTADLRIQHYSGGVWETLGTTVVSTDGEIVLEAPVSSFSPFAVTAVDPQPEPTDDTTEPAPTPPESIPSAIDDETPGFGLLGAILGLLCAGLIGRRIDSRTQ